MSKPDTYLGRTLRPIVDLETHGAPWCEFSTALRRAGLESFRTIWEALQRAQGLETTAQPVRHGVSIVTLLDDLGGSKVGDRAVPSRSGWWEACNQALTSDISDIWNRTFGGKTQVGVLDLQFFPHLSRSEPFPAVPSRSGNSSGNRFGPSPEPFPTLREGTARTALTGGSRNGSKTLQDPGTARDA